MPPKKGGKPAQQNDPPNAPTGKNCNIYVSKVEEGYKAMLSLRNKYKKKEITEIQYKSQMDKWIHVVQSSLTGVRRTYLPLSIPKHLLLSTNPPRWVPMTREQVEEYVSIANQSLLDQQNLIRKYKRPGLRSCNIMTAATALGIEQNRHKEQMMWEQYTHLLNCLVLSLRPAFTKHVIPNNKFVSNIKEFMEENSVDYAVVPEDLSIVLISLFEEEGILCHGIPKTDVETEVKTISSALHQLMPSIEEDEIVFQLLPYIADLHQDEMLEKLRPKVVAINALLDEAISIYSEEEATMGDFGETDGEVDIMVTDSISKLQKFQGVERLAYKFNQAGIAALDATNGNETKATQMIAASIVNSKMDCIPLHFLYAVAWCSEEKLRECSTFPLYIKALDDIINVVPSFEE